MRRRSLARLALLALVSGLLAAQPPGPLRIMTFNVRYPNPDDGPDFWERRKDIAVAMVRKYDPDIFGTQELFHEQGEYLVEKMPGYRWFGISRRGSHTDEHMGVFYKTGAIELLEHGNFWLSETPEIPASMSWNVSLPRLVTWGLLQRKAGGGRFYFVNTHFPHRREDAEARVRCAEVIAKFIASLPTDVPIILTGDFNDPAGGAVHETLTQHLRDSWAVAAKRQGPEGTFHGFKGRPEEARIDWILFRGPWNVSLAETVTYEEQGRYPSDHFPVFAIFGE